MDEVTKNQKFISLENFKWNPNSQDVKIMVGTPVIANLNSEKLDICNNDVFEVCKISKTLIQVFQEEYDEDTNKNIVRFIDIETKDFTRMFNVAYAITCHKSQGQTITEEYAIWEWHKMTKRLKYVALSRGTKKSNVNIM